MDMLSDFYKENKTDKIWWVKNLGTVGEFLFSFDKKRIFNMFAEYPYALTAEQKKTFDEENQYWADFFKSRDEDDVEEWKKERKLERDKEIEQESAEIQKALRKYYSMFDNYFPIFQFKIEKTDEEFLSMLNDCIEQKKDVVELGYC